MQPRYILPDAPILLSRDRIGADLEPAVRNQNGGSEPGARFVRSGNGRSRGGRTTRSFPFLGGVTGWSRLSGAVADRPRGAIVAVASKGAVSGIALVIDTGQKRDRLLGLIEQAVALGQEREPPSRTWPARRLARARRARGSRQSVRAGSGACSKLGSGCGFRFDRACGSRSRFVRGGGYDHVVALQLAIDTTGDLLRPRAGCR